MGKVFIDFSGKKSKREQGEKPPTLVGKTVRYRIGEGTHAMDVVGFVKAQDCGVLSVAPMVPNSNGVLFVSKEAVFQLPLDSVDEISVEARTNCGFKAFETNDPLQSVKAATEIKEGDRIIDYYNVTFEGYGSTFQNLTPKDRDGDYIIEGAFDNTLRSFMENPVMLVDHTRKVAALMGHYEKVSIVPTGLVMRGRVTNSPHSDAVHTRFQIMEGSLKTLSIGGFFYYAEDYRGVEEIDLFETSLVVVPANPDARFVVRAATEEIVAKAFNRYLNLNGGQLRAKVA